jgi:hypothetical protein
MSGLGEDDTGIDLLTQYDIIFSRISTNSD